MYITYNELNQITGKISRNKIVHMLIEELSGKWFVIGYEEDAESYYLSPGFVRREECVEFMLRL